ncbi:MAG: hypothetical protein AB7V50_08520 [Vampirovibrionia bacterium]
MGFVKSLFTSPTKPKESVEPTLLLNDIPETSLQGVFVNGNSAGINTIPGLGTGVGLYGLDNLNKIYSQSQNQLYSLMPDVGRVTDNDLTAGNQLSNYLYSQGKADIDSNLQTNVKDFREDTFRRGLGASSSMLNGMQNLYSANSRALADLRSTSDTKGLEYAMNLANMRSDSAKFLSDINNDIYRQVNEVPLQLGLDYSIPQAELSDSNKQLNLDRLVNYYQIYNKGIDNYNSALNDYNKINLGYATSQNSNPLQTLVRGITSYPTSFFR